MALACSTAASPVSLTAPFHFCSVCLASPPEYEMETVLSSANLKSNSPRLKPFWVAMPRYTPLSVLGFFLHRASWFLHQSVVCRHSGSVRCVQRTHWPDV